jgi:hypothetical protein
MANKANETNIHQQYLDSNKEMRDKQNADKFDAYEREIGILGNDQDRFDRNTERVDSLGDQDRFRLDQRFDQLGADTEQNATGRGLGNTTIRDTMQRGVTEARQQAHNDLSDQLLREKLGVDMQLSGDQIARKERLLGQADARNTSNRSETRGNLAEMLQFLERIQNVYPNQQLWAGLAQQYGAGGGAIGNQLYGQAG